MLCDQGSLSWVTALISVRTLFFKDNRSLNYNPDKPKTGSTVERKMRSFKFSLLLLFIMPGLLTAQNAFEKASPTKTPRLFYPDQISRNGIQWNNSFTQNGDQVFYTIQGKTRAYLVTQRFDGEKYGAIEPLPFDSAYLYSDVMVNETGDQVWFMATIPHPTTGKTDFNLWQSKLKSGQWSKPTPMGEATSGEGNEGYPCPVSSGNLYFSVARDGSRNSDIHVLKPGETASQALPAPIQTDKFEGDAYISPDESFIIFAAFDKPDGLGFSDLYISIKHGRNWAEPKNMGINSPGYDGSPFVTHDGKYLIFTSSRNSPNNNSFFNHYILRFDIDDYR